MKKVTVGRSKGIADAEQCDIHVVMLSFWYSTVKWLVLKPLVKLSYIINGKVIGDVKWYQRHFTTPARWKWLNNITYKLSIYVMFK